MWSSTGGMSIVQSWDAEPVFPAASVTLTEKRWGPSARPV